MRIPSLRPLTSSSNRERHRASSSVEILEARIAPAAVFVSATSAKYTDIDGDKVTVKFSLPILTQANVTAVLETAASGVGDQLQEINLTSNQINTPVSGVGITVTAAKVAHGSGDGLVNVGYINATGINVGDVTIKGDLGLIVAGSGSATIPGIGALNVHSMGLFGEATQSTTAPTLASVVTGTLGTLKVSGNIQNVSIMASEIGGINVGGSIVGGATMASGFINSTGSIGPVKVGGSLIGGTGAASGAIYAATTIGNVTISGSLIGGGNESASVEAQGNIGNVKIGGNVVGGSGTTAGEVNSIGGGMGTLTIRGSVAGGGGEFSGDVGANNAVGTVKIGGDLRGGSGDQTGQLIGNNFTGAITIGGSLIGGSNDNAGEIFTFNGNIGAVKIGGSIIGGGASGMTDTGEISSAGTLGQVTIGGSLYGGIDGNSGYINSGGTIAGVKIGKDIVGGSNSAVTVCGEVQSGAGMGSVTVGGSVIGGAAKDSAEIIADGTMGAIHIGGNFVGGTAQDSGGIQASGDVTSVKIGGSVYSGTAHYTAEIESGATLGPVSVKGDVVGNAANAVLIRGEGVENAAQNTDIAIASLTVGGFAQDTLVLGGYGGGNAADNGNAQIGAVKVGGNWTASSITAGIEDTASGGISAGFGNGTDKQISATPGGTIVPSIASIDIGGIVIGDAGAGDHFGFDAEKIGSFKYDGITVALPATQPPVANDTIALSPTTGDVAIEIVS